MLAICGLPFALTTAQASAEIPAKSAMTVGAVVVKPCLISDRDNKNICHKTVRKTNFDNAVHDVVGDAGANILNSTNGGVFIEYEF
jgi:hypothetical protein